MDYESIGRAFESLQAHHKIRHLRNYRKCLTSKSEHLSEHFAGDFAVKAACACGSAG